MLGGVAGGVLVLWSSGSYGSVVLWCWQVSKIAPSPRPGLGGGAILRLDHL